MELVNALNEAAQSIKILIGAAALVPVVTLGIVGIISLMVRR